jgi:hypothetical protein
MPLWGLETLDFYQILNFSFTFLGFEVLSNPFFALANFSTF